MDISLKDGATISFTGFTPKEKNLRLIEIFYSGDNREEIFAFFPDGSLTRYQDHTAVSDHYEEVVVLAASAKMFQPKDTWGLCLPIRFNGAGLPSCDCFDLDGQMTFCQKTVNTTVD